ncbi:MAG: hypothetical protein KAW45_01695 [Thermoplasmatales archaeon]|nr:hypothetical protein [Thermoplasmatales archaeon]
MKQINKIKKNSKNDAQLLLLAGIFLSVSIVALSSVMVSLVNADVSIDETSFIKPDYDNVRKEFGMALKDKLEGKLDYSESSVIAYFNDTRDIFVFFIESLNGNYFNAEYLGLARVGDEIVGITCFLKLGNDNEFVSEIITYDIY